MPSQIRFQRKSPVNTPATFVARLALTAIGVLAATQIVPGLHCASIPGLLVTALVLGALNAFLRPLLLLVSLPLVVLSFGLFLWIINASLLTLASWMVKSFEVESFFSALGGAAVISVVSVLGGSLLGLNRPVTLTTGSTTTPHESAPDPRPSPPGRGRGPGDGPGPVIDV